MAPAYHAMVLAQIAIEELGRRFGDGVAVLTGIQATIHAGAFTVLVGPSGCGKTTLLRIVGGLDAPTHGQVRFLDATGAPIATQDIGIAFAFQEPRLLPWRNVLDNIALPLELAGVDRQARRLRAQDLTRLVGLADAETKLPQQLSGGMRMRTAIARALVTRPRVLLLDEPFGALDEITRHTLDDLLLTLWRDLSMTVIMVTHSIVEAAYLGEEVLVMAPAPGRIVARVQPSVGVRSPALRATPEFAAVTAQILRALGAAMATSATPTTAASSATATPASPKRVDA